MSCTVSSRVYGITHSGEEVTQYVLSNGNGIEVGVINYGCTITSLKVPDRDGRMGDIVLGYDTLEAYLACTESVGCVVGRYANRIAYGRFDLNGKTYFLDTNLPPHHLHGGKVGWNKKIWSASPFQESHACGIVFKLKSPDCDEGYPGAVDVEVKYVLHDDQSLAFEYRASSDMDTVINLTQHTYFNLNGGHLDILDHLLTIPSNATLEVDKDMIPTGRMMEVNNTPFDFNTPKSIRRDIDAVNEQLAYGHGYDHCWILDHQGNDVHHAATLFDPFSGRSMEVWTTEPGMQVYTANFLKSSKAGKNGMELKPRLGVCLETQHYPDSPNHPNFPSTMLKAGEWFTSKTVLRFSIQ